MGASCKCRAGARGNSTTATAPSTELEALADAIAASEEGELRSCTAAWSALTPELLCCLRRLAALTKKGSKGV